LVREWVIDNKQIQHCIQDECWDSDQVLFPVSFCHGGSLTLSLRFPLDASEDLAPCGWWDGWKRVRQ